MLATNFSTTLPLFVTDSLHRSDREFTILYSVFSAGAVVSALIVAHRGLVRLRNIIVGAALLGVAMMILALMPNAATATIAVFLVGMASILYLTATTALVQVESERAMRGRVLSFQAVLMGGTRLLGAPILGWLADKSGGRVPIIVGALACLAAAALGNLAARRYEVE